MADTEKNMPGPDIAYRILKESKNDIYFRDLLTAVLTEKKVPSYLMTPAMAELHTQINMDSRFVHMGKGMWGLVEWSPQQLSGRSAVEKDESVKTSSTVRRQKLFEEIQQEYVAANAESGERE